MRFKTLVSLLMVLSCMTASVASVVFPADADILTVVDLTPEQTLALYGTSIQGQYYDGSDWRNVTFEYFAKSTDFTEANSAYTTNIFETEATGYTTDQITSLLRNNTFLFYRATMQNYSTIPYNTKIQFNITFSVDISAIAYYRQIIGFTRYVNSGSPSIVKYMPFIPDACVNSIVSYSATPVTSILHGDQFSYSGDLLCNGYFRTQCSPISSVDGYSPPFAFSDVYLQDIDSQTGLENTFSISGQTFSFNRAFYYYTELSSSGGEPYYIIAISTPRVTDGYVLPTPETTAPDYSGQLSDIYDGIGANTTLLQSILAKLDLIYHQMQANGLPSPTLTPAQTIPPTLQQYYSGIASGAPSVSAVNSAIGGASDFIPLGAILSSSGLGSLLGVLAGLCCAGWVLTRGRSG